MLKILLTKLSSEFLRAVFLVNALLLLLIPTQLSSKYVEF